MVTFTELKSWDLDESGNAKLQLSSADGSFRELVLTRPLMTALLVVLNRFLMDTVNEHPEGVRELLMAQVPTATEIVSLPGGEYALSIRGQAGTTHQFPIVGDALTILSSAIADLSAILQAESSSGPPGRH